MHGSPVMSVRFELIVNLRSRPCTRQGAHKAFIGVPSEMLIRYIDQLLSVEQRSE